MDYLVIGLILFLGIHSVSIISMTWRDKLVAKVGPLAWQGIYSLIAIAGFMLIIKGYSQASQSAIMLYHPASWLRYVAFALMIFVFPLLLATYSPGRIKTVTKHPMLAATKIWALAHLLVNGGLHDVVLFGSFLVWAIVDRISMKRRASIPLPALPASSLNDAIIIVLGLVLYATFIFGLHGWLIGVPLKI